MQAAWQFGGALMARRSGDHDYMMRSERRPGQRPGAGAPEPPRRRKKRRSRHPVYALVTVLCLLVLYPIGLIMLWMRKLRWSSGTKLFLSIVTGVIFFVLCAIALNVKVDNPTLADWQSRAKAQLGHVTTAVHRAVSDKDTIQDNLTVQGPMLVNLAVDKGVDAFETVTIDVSNNLRKIYKNAGNMLVQLTAYVEREAQEFTYITGIRERPAGQPQRPAAPEATAAPTPDQATPPSTDMATPTPGLPTSGPTQAPPTQAATVATPPPTPAGTVVSPSPASVGAASAVVTPSPALSVAVSPTPAEPTAAPTATPRPTPSPTPIVLPDPKPFGQAVVYFFDASKYYHASTNCSNMNGAPARTLEEASSMGKQRCSTCKPPELSLVTAPLAVWCGTDETFHITDECAALTEAWTGLPFEEAWLEDGMIGCSLCGADLYVEDQIQNPVTTPVPAPIIVQ